SGDILLGRAPRAIPGRACRLVRLPSPTQAISRNHAIVAPRDGGLAIEGLGALNGTRLRRGQHPPYLVGRGQVVPLFPADVLDLGDDVTLTIGPPGGPA
ncbi:MAG: FHA domain-containing protein, partial [Propionibacteriaceae bacterium]|nr:FHA domain-containing protein [Propionibacteriaceae bacterium]